jgi:hypothetical protein
MLIWSVLYHLLVLRIYSAILEVSRLFFMNLKCSMILFDLSTRCVKKNTRNFRFFEKIFIYSSTLLLSPSK